MLKRLSCKTRKNAVQESVISTQKMSEMNFKRSVANTLNHFIYTFKI